MQSEVVMRHARRMQGMAPRRRSHMLLPVTLVLIALAALVGGTLGPAALAPRWLQAEAAPQTFVFTGTPQMYVVPDGVTSITVTAKGAQGNTVTGGGTGGLGGALTATIAVNPGEVLQVMVGGVTYNGGGAGAGGGGGGSDIRRPAFSTNSSCAFTLSCALTQRIIVAGGGGGGGTYAGSHGGAGGQTAVAGSAGNATGGDATGGGAGTASGGGAAGSGTFTTAGEGAAAGSFGAGGNKAWVAGATGGGGGGGYYGGGGGGVSQNSAITPQFDGAGGGGGGSSWAGGTGVSGATFSDGSSSGNGSIIIDPPSAITNAAYGFIAATQSYVIPSNITKMYVRLYAGAGAGSTGDIVYGQLPVTPGETLQLNVGGRGWGSVPDTGFTAFQGGWNGGGNGGPGWANHGGGGGGATDIRRCATAASGTCTPQERLVVAGGGGASNVGGWGQFGGTGGVASTGEGGNGSTGHATGGTGGTLTAPGTKAGTSATDGSGAAGGSTPYGGAGGGGYYGGGGGESVGGGGGSSYASVTGPDPTWQGVGNVLGQTAAPFAHDRGGSAADGLIIITAMPLATTGASTGITTSAANIAGTANPQHLATTPRVYYSTNQTTVNNGGGSTLALTSNTGLATLAGASFIPALGTITGLTANTTYYYRVCADSVAGSGCGTTSSFTTLPNGTVPPIPGTPTVTATSSSTGSFTGTATSGSSSTTVVYECSASATFASIATTGTATESPMAGQTAETASGSCTGLGASTTYYVRMVASITVNGITYVYPSASATFTTAAGASSGGGGAGEDQPAPDAEPSTSAPAQPAPALPPLAPVIASRPPAGNAALLVNGFSVPATVFPVDANRAIRITGPGFWMALAGANSQGAPLGLTPDGALILESDRFASTWGSGFMKESPIKLYLFSQPVYLGDVLTNAQGEFLGQVQLPMSIPAGRHTIQANGYTPEGAVRSVSLPVIVQAATSRPAVRKVAKIVTFAPLSATLTDASKAKLRAMARTVKARAVRTVAIGYVQGTVTTSNDLSLSTKRAKAVVTYLKSRGVKGVFIVRGEGKAKEAGSTARRVNVVISYVK
jgi:outer membrane protein OmpA-like peptidoglycan-associated protein